MIYDHDYIDPRYYRNWVRAKEAIMRFWYIVLWHCFWRHVDPCTHTEARRKIECMCGKKRPHTLSELRERP